MIGDLTVSQNLRLTGADRPRSATSCRNGPGRPRPGRAGPRIPCPSCGCSTWPGRSPSIRSCWCSTRSRRRCRPTSDRVFAIMARWKERNRSVLFISHGRGPPALRHVHRPARRPRRRLLPPRSEGGESQIVAAMLAEAGAGVRDVARERAAKAEGERTQRLVVRDLLIDRQDAGVSFEVAAGEVWGWPPWRARARTGCSRSSPGTSGPPAARSSSTASRCGPGTRTTPSGAGSSWCPASPGPAAAAAHPGEHRHPAVQPGRPLGADQRRPGAAPGPGRGHAAVHRHPRRRPGRRLSGGNQQKLTIGRWLAAGFRTLLLFDPTRGIDVGTKHQIYDLIRELADGGAAIVMFTSELREIGLVCDRAVLHNEAIVAEMPPTASRSTCSRPPTAWR